MPCGFRLVADSKSKDIVISYKDKPATLYLDQLTAEYKAQPLAEVPAGAMHLTALDLDNDGNLDMAFAASGVGESCLATSERSSMRRWMLGPAPGVFADLGNRGFTDFIAGGSVRQNVGDLQFIKPEAESGIPKQATAWAHADFNGDGLAGSRRDRRWQARTADEPDDHRESLAAA